MSSPIFEQLEVTPDILRPMIGHLRAEEANWKPAPHRFSAAEVMAHLRDVEQQVFRRRLERMVNEERPSLDAYDQEGIASAGGYAGRDMHETFRQFHGLRRDNLSYLESLPTEVHARIGVHPELGPMTIGHLLNEWAFHDLGHIRQIAELVRAYRYYPNLGAFQRYYTVNP